MPPYPPNPSNRASKRRRAAFTLTELLVVLVVVALLVCIRLPALARVKTQTWIVQCSGNLKQVGMSFLLYGNDNGGRLPSTSVGYWPWDMTDQVFRSLSSSGGVQRTNLFCPSNPYQNQTLLWSYGGSYHVTGYAYTYPGVAAGNGGLIASNYNPTVTPQQQFFAPFVYVVPAAAKRVLVADAELCAGPSYDPSQPLSSYNFTDIAGGAGPFPDGRHHRASHLVGKSPLGGNLGMLDGHVEWRPLRSSSYNMIQRNQAQLAPGTPCFLW